MLRGLWVVAGISVAAPCLADVPILSAPDVAARLQSGNMVMLDIRSPAEWKETGLAAGAWPVSMHEKGFVQQLQAVITQYSPDNVALICATGGRTAHVTKILEANGISGIADVSEGMMGNQRGPGWIDRGMSVVTLEEADAAYRAVFPSQ